MSKYAFGKKKRISRYCLSISKMCKKDVSSQAEIWSQMHLEALCIDHMLMTSQKCAPACWGSNEALPRAPSPSMQPAGHCLHAIPPGWPGPAHSLRGWWERQRALPAQLHVRAKSWPPTWRRCYGDVMSMHKVYLLSLYRQVRVRRALSLFTDVPLGANSLLSLYKVCGGSALVVLNWTSLNSDNALLVLSRRYIPCAMYIFSLLD